MKRRIFLGALAMASATAPLFAQQEKPAFPVEIKISGKPYQAVLSTMPRAERFGLSFL